MPETVRSASCPEKYHVCYAPLLQSSAVYMYAALLVSTHSNECLFLESCGGAHVWERDNKAKQRGDNRARPLSSTFDTVYPLLTRLVCACACIHHGKPSRTVRGQQTTASCIHRRRHDVHRGVLCNPAAGAGHQVRGGPAVADAGECTCDFWSAYLTRFQANPDAKVPSVLMYDRTGKPQVRRGLRH
jgi:hypothetical protein